MKYFFMLIIFLYLISLIRSQKKSPKSFSRGRIISSIRIKTNRKIVLRHGNGNSKNKSVTLLKRKGVIFLFKFYINNRNLERKGYRCKNRDKEKGKEKGKGKGKGKGRGTGTVSLRDRGPIYAEKKGTEIKESYLDKLEAFEKREAANEIHEFDETNKTDETTTTDKRITANENYQKTFFVTTPIYYANDKPHIGHAYCNILGDTIMRFEKLQNEITPKKKKTKYVFFSGMDEHGLKIEMRSRMFQISSQKYVDEMCEYYKNMNKLFNIHVDVFCRTSNTFHKCFVQNVWSYLLEKKLIYKDVYKGYYDINEESYVSETQLSIEKYKIEKNEVPVENNNDAENNEKEPEKKKRNLIYIEEPNSYFFDILQFKQFLINFYESNTSFLYPTYLRKEILHILKNELKNICISRYNTTWGVPIPNEPKGTIYVWFDALLSYVSSVLYLQQKEKIPSLSSTSTVNTEKENQHFNTNPFPFDFSVLSANEKKKNQSAKCNETFIKENTTTDEFVEPGSVEHIWKPNVQIVGRDILKFHCILYICLLKSLHLELPEKILCHGLITHNNIKMSKSLNNVVSPFDLLQHYSPDIIRMYLISCSNISEDKNYSEQNIKSFESFVRNNIGNLLYRIISLCISNNVHTISSIDKTAYNSSVIINECRKKRKEFVQLVNNFEYPHFIEKIMTLIKNINKYFVHKEPWKLINEKKKNFYIIMYETLECIKFFSVFLYPLIPNISLKIFKMLGLPSKDSEISFSLLNTPTPNFFLNKLTKLI